MGDDSTWTLLLAADPEAATTYPLPEDRLERIVGGANGSAAPSRDRAVRWFERWPSRLGGVVAVAAAALACALVLSVSNVDRVQNAAAAALNNAARSAARQPASVVAGPGRYLYVEAIEGQRMSVSVGGTSRSALCVRTVRDWAAADGSGRQVSGDPSPAWCDISPSQSFPAGQEIDGEVYPGARDLPADATQLKQFIVAHYEGGKSDDDATFQFAGTFLQAGATPQVRAALYRMIATFPKVESLGPMTDMLGRRGIGVGMTSYGVRDVLIFDPATSAVLEREGVVADPAAMAWPKDSARLPVGATINYTVYKSSAVVSSLTAAP